MLWRLSDLMQCDICGVEGISKAGANPVCLVSAFASFLDAKL
jgi:hypothetical protein